MCSAEGVLVVAQLANMFYHGDDGAQASQDQKRLAAQQKASDAAFAAANPPRQGAQAAASTSASGTGRGSADTLLTGPFGIDSSLLGIAKPGYQGNTLLGG
jgi:hypothetical protein